MIELSINQMENLQGGSWWTKNNSTSDHAECMTAGILRWLKCNLSYTARCSFVRRSRHVCMLLLQIIRFLPQSQYVRTKKEVRAIGL